MNTRFAMILMVSVTTALASTVMAGEGKDKNKGNVDKKAEILKEFDKDGDGKLSQEEKKAMHEARKAKLLKEFDKDGDGKLNDEEKKAMQQARKQKGQGKKKGHDKKKKGKEE